jgi:hypothetical protein
MQSDNQKKHDLCDRKHHLRARMVANLIETVGNLEALPTADPDDLASELEIIGARLRTEMQAVQGRGLLMFAKVILDHANTTGMK